MTDFEPSESRVRSMARRHGYAVRKSRQRLHVPNLDNHGGYLLVEAHTNLPALGFQFDASLADILAYLMEEFNRELEEATAA